MYTVTYTFTYTEIFKYIYAKNLCIKKYTRILNIYINVTIPHSAEAHTECKESEYEKEDKGQLVNGDIFTLFIGYLSIFYYLNVYDYIYKCIHMCTDTIFHIYIFIILLTYLSPISERVLPRRFSSILLALRPL